MKIKLYWGLAILIILLVGVSVMMLTRTTDTEPENVYKDREPSIAKPPPTEPGYKWVWHQNHWDKVPINMQRDQTADKNPQQSEAIILDVDFSEHFDSDEYNSFITRYIDQQMHLYADEYNSLVTGYIDYHMDLYPDCKDHNAVLKDAQHNAKWILTDRICSEISKELDKVSYEIDSEFAKIYYDDAGKTSFSEDFSYYFARLETMNDNEKQTIISKLNTLIKKSEVLAEKEKILYQTRIPYEEPSHTHK